MSDIFEQPCGQRLAPALRSEVDRLRRLGELRCSDAAGEQLKEISPSTIDRLLRREKGVRMLRRNRNPNVQRLIYEKVPVKVAAEWGTEEIGNLQVDFVLHCGRSTGGNYTSTISAVDIATNWWEGQAITVRSQHATKEALEQMRPRFPFRIREVHPDNDSALINDLLWDWCQQHRIRLSRSRPYKKNDNAWIEQKNWTHVRKVVGYRRYDKMSELRVLNEIYAVLRVYKNFCLPTIKLKSKTRVNGRIKRVYDDPRTPYERVMGSRHIDRKTKRQLGESTRRSIPPSYTGASRRFANSWKRSVAASPRCYGSRRIGGRTSFSAAGANAPRWDECEWQQTGRARHEAPPRTRGGFAPATPKAFHERIDWKHRAPSRWSGPNSTLLTGVKNTLGLHFHLTQPRPVWVTSLNDLTGDSCRHGDTGELQHVASDHVADLLVREAKLDQTHGEQRPVGPGHALGGGAVVLERLGPEGFPTCARPRPPRDLPVFNVGVRGLMSHVSGDSNMPGAEPFDGVLQVPHHGANIAAENQGCSRYRSGRRCRGWGGSRRPAWTGCDR